MNFVRSASIGGLCTIGFFLGHMYIITAISNYEDNLWEVIWVIFFAIVIGSFVTFALSEGKFKQ